MANERTATEIVKLYFERVWIRSSGQEYLDTVDNFALDSGRRFPATPAGFFGRTYIPGELHNLHAEGKSVPQRLPWAPGDALLLTVDTLLANQAAREAVKPDDGPNLDVLRLAAIDALIDERAREANPPQAILDYIEERDG